MRTGRPRKPIPTHEIHAKIAEPIYAEILVLLADPASPTLKIKSGALSTLIERLLIDWINAQKRQSPSGIQPPSPSQEPQHEPTRT